MKNKLWLIISSFFMLSACASSNVDVERPTMREVHEKHKMELFGGSVERARKSWQMITDYEDNRVNFHDDLRLPNPELEMLYFPKRNEDGSVSQSYAVKFSMYEKVHYRLGM